MEKTVFSIQILSIWKFPIKHKVLCLKVEPHLAYVELMFGLKGVIALETSQWARKPNRKVNSSFSKVQSLKDIFKEGDVVWVHIRRPSKSFSKLQEPLKEILKTNRLLTLEQEPKVQGALISFDHEYSRYYCYGWRLRFFSISI